MGWVDSGSPGIRCYQHGTRKHGVRFDRCYYIHHKVDGKILDEKIGWMSQGVTLENAKGILAELKLNKANKVGPRTYKEKKELLRQEKDSARLNKEAAAEAAKIEAIREADANRTLSEYWSESYFPAAQRSKKANSWSKEETHFRLWIEPLLGKLPL